MEKFNVKRKDLLERAHRCWESLRDFRDRRERFKRYAYGNQWGDIVEVDGKKMTEEAYIRKEGAIPLKNNFINRFLRNVVGVYRSQAKEPGCVARDLNERGLGETMSTVLQYNWQLNRMNELLSSVMKEYLISGAAIVRKSWGRRNGKTDCWTDTVSPRLFFVDDSMSDIRGWDVNDIGELRDLTFSDLLAEFARSESEMRRLGEIYTNRYGNDEGGARRDFGGETPMADFLNTADPTKCRVIEIWSRERHPRYICHDRRDATVYSQSPEDYVSQTEPEKQRRSESGEPQIEARWEFEEVWMYRCLAPDGTLLREIQSPYAHGGHPYVFKFHPFIDGEVHSFLEDVIDQQRYVNRLVTLYDWTIRSSAKGLLLYPVTCLPSGMTLEDVGKEWSRYNGILPIRPNVSGEFPRQISSNTSSPGIHDLLNIQLRFFEEISGVNGALQGKPGYSGMSASLYAQQTQNATLSLLDILESFSDFVVDGAYKDVKNIQQYYSDERLSSISGQIGRLPSGIRNAEFDLAVAETTSTAAYRQLANDWLHEMWRSGDITAEQFMRYGDLPFGKKLSGEMRDDVTIDANEGKNGQ